MKQYVAFLSGSVNNSGQRSRDEAEKWAAKQLADKPQIEAVTITEVIGEYRRTTPAVEFRPVGPTIIRAEDDDEVQAA